MARLLLLGCSRRKRPAPGCLPAIERYDGPILRVLRKYLRVASGDNLHIFLLSAQFGLISVYHPVPDYDRKMTIGRARELQPPVSVELLRILSAGTYEDVLVLLGRKYVRALDLAILAERGYRLRVAGGPTGKQSAELHDWLYRAPPPLRERITRRGMDEIGRARLRGQEIVASCDDVFTIARKALAGGTPGASRYRAWCVDVDDVAVGPKWLVSVLTGLPVGAFVTDEARRILAELGVPVRRALTEDLS